MQFPDTTKLYIYKPGNQYTLNIVSEQLLWASKPEHFNDPFDCELRIATPVTEDSVRAAFQHRNGEPNNWPEHVSQFASTILDAHGNFTQAGRTKIDHETQVLFDTNRDSGIVCLTERPDSILMWSHYALHHTGVCLQFERNPTNTLGDDGICSRVVYSELYPQIDLGKILSHADGRTLDLMMSYKASEWAYEKEWRLITEKGDMNCRLPGRLERVIFGIRTDHSYKAAMTQICERQMIPLAQAQYR